MGLRQRHDFESFEMVLVVGGDITGSGITSQGRRGAHLPAYAGPSYHSTASMHGQRQIDGVRDADVPALIGRP